MLEEKVQTYTSSVHDKVGAMKAKLGNEIQAGRYAGGVEVPASSVGLSAAIGLSPSVSQDCSMAKVEASRNSTQPALDPWFQGTNAAPAPAGQSARGSW